jgi:hypothetical protein
MPTRPASRRHGQSKNRKPCIGPMLLRPLTDIELCLAHRIRVDDVDNFPQVSAATAETSPYFSGEFLNELGAANFHHILFASRVFSLGLFSNRAAVQTMTKREDLRKEFLAIAELRLMKVEEIRELLSISPAASVEEILRIMKCWQDSGDGSTQAELRSQAHRLLSEIRCLNGATLEILDKLRPVAPTTASILSYKYERMQ